MDINEDAERSLMKTGYSIVFQYPQCFSELPVISFYTTDERGTAAYDNIGAFRDGTVAVDIWARSPRECADISAQVRDAMLSDGWSELFSADVPRGSGDIYHRTIRLVKSFYTDTD